MKCRFLFRPETGKGFPYFCLGVTRAYVHNRYVRTHSSSTYQQSRRLSFFVFFCFSFSVFVGQGSAGFCPLPGGGVRARIDCCRRLIDLLLSCECI